MATTKANLAISFEVGNIRLNVCLNIIWWQNLKVWYFYSLYIRKLTLKCFLTYSNVHLEWLIVKRVHSKTATKVIKSTRNVLWKGLRIWHTEKAIKFGMLHFLSYYNFWKTLGSPRRFHELMIKLSMMQESKTENRSVFKRVTAS